LMSKGHAESMLELKFDAETDSGVRFDPKASKACHIDIIVIIVRRMIITIV
jgi:hypothetical protein